MIAALKSLTTDPSEVHLPQHPQKILLEKYVDAVMHAPSSLGLTAATDEREFWERHILDALRLIEFLSKKDHESNLKIIDVGTGNGIPGLPVAVALPNWQVTLLDSNNTKCGFIDMFCKSNDINNVSVVRGRAEVIAHENNQRSMYDIVFGRALGKLPTALELCAAFIRMDGVLLIPHGPSYRSALSDSEKAIRELGLRLDQSSPYQISERQYYSLIFKKVTETPDRYPRKTGFPKKYPL